MSEQLSRQQVADRCGLQPKTLDTYRRRGVMPKPDGMVGRSPWWDADKIDTWDADRRKHSTDEEESD